MVVRKVLLVIFLCILAVFIVLSVRLNIINNMNKSIESEINEQTSINNKVIEDNKTYQDNIENIKKENKDKWEELEIWQKAKAKLEKALS